MAQKCYDEEVEQRNLTAPEEDGSVERNGSVTARDQANGGNEDRSGLDAETGAAPAWLDDAACACAFAAFPGSPATSDAENARAVLRARELPCHVSVHEVDPPSADPPPRSEFRVMLPGALNLQATSVLDVEIFNAEAEAGCRTHFAPLSRENLPELNSQI